jgi:hypothetical protein
VCSLFVPEGRLRVARQELPGSFLFGSASPTLEVRLVPTPTSIRQRFRSSGASEAASACKPGFKRPSGTRSELNSYPAFHARLLSTVPPGHRCSAVSQHMHLLMLTPIGGRRTRRFLDTRGICGLGRLVLLQVLGTVMKSICTRTQAGRVTISERVNYTCRQGVSFFSSQIEAP